MATIYRDLVDPIGAPGTTRYLGCLLRLPTTGPIPELFPKGARCGIELQGTSSGASIYMGIVNSVGPKLMLTRFLGSTFQAATRTISEGVSYFCVLKLEFGATSTMCSMFIGGNEANGPDAVLQIPAGALDTIDITSNYKFSLDEIRLADTLDELSLTAGTPPNLIPASLTYSIPEGNSGTNQVAVKVSMDKASAFDAIMKITPVAGSATEDDFVSAAEEIRFAAGELEKTFFIKVRGDQMVELDERFTVLVTGIAGAQISSSKAYLDVQILNDDARPAQVTLSIRKNGGYEVNWILSSTRLALQQSADLVHWVNVSPLVFSDTPGPFKIETTAGRAFFRFRTP